MRKLWSLSIVMCLSLAVSSVLAQDVLTKGSIGGTVTDSTGAAIAGAKVTITGQTGERTETTNENGTFKVDNLIPGTYMVKVEQTGFKTAVANNITVNVGKESSLNLKLETGEITATVDVTATAGGIDQQSTASGQNLNDQLFQNVPVQRGVSSLFYLSPGATDSINGGRDNPSIAGGSALDNLYVADGVNITNSAFGGVGTFSRSYGALGTGINTSFIKEVQVKTGGFEPQYGQSEGGIINIITQSGGNAYHGAVYGFARPSAFESNRLQPDDTRVNKQGKLLHEENYDVGADLGGYVPGLQNRLFFFGSFNPTIRREIVQGVSANASDIAAGNGDAVNSGLFTQRGQFARRYRTYNYAGKLDWVLNPNHQVTFSIFGDPTKTNLSSFSALNIDNTTGDSVLDYGTRNWAVRYNGSLSPTWTLNSSFSQGRSKFDETGFANLNLIQIRTPIDPVRGNYVAEGRGFFEPTESSNWKWDINTAKIWNRWGQHQVGVGYTYQRSLYSGNRERSGPRYTIPSENVIGTPAADLGIPDFAAGQQFNVQFRLRSQAASCTLCPLFNVRGDLVPVSLQVFRGEFGPPNFDTRGNYNAGYVQDTWRVNKYITALLGLRMEQERVIGSPNSTTGAKYAYSFTDQWSPRLGVAVDPTGKGNMKVYYNFGRFFEFLPLDAAERSLSQELDFIGARFAPAFTINGAGQRIVTLDSFGSPIPVIDPAHLLSGAAAAGGLSNGISVSASDLSAITAGTKLGYQDEHIIGAEFQLPHNFVLSARYQYRNLKRIIEDMAVLSPEAANAGVVQTFFIGNPSSKLDAATNLVQFSFPIGGTAPAGCTSGFETEVDDPLTGTPISNVCFGSKGINPVTGASINVPDGVPDGFPDPVRKYKAFELELNKRFSDGWQLLSNFRVASLTGNYEGHLRNDNGQTDPGISSLFDFTAGDFNLLGDQFKVGPLNTDRRFISNIYGNYSFSKGRSLFSSRYINGLNIGAGFHMESGIPISEFLPHPVYLNAGEIPVGGRGKLGRTPFFAQLDLHADYPWVINERAKVSFIADFFNVTNNRRVRLPDQFRQLDLGANNPDFLQPSIINLTSGYHLPFSMRLGMRFEF
ncbi:MAG TPA: carboxypeptidase regulatory-like domain-containing protein [Pyrinomonadaceae bacterium]|jgi:Outer membrane receptor proteins, mostly Fe transport|nr:carboxypeptidase regulatory-like domain-containing protein [Pyrinomonadaceae bacterium]